MEGRMDEVWWRDAEWSSRRERSQPKGEENKLLFFLYLLLESIPKCSPQFKSLPSFWSNMLSREDLINPFPRKHKIERTSLNHTSVLFFRLGECTSYLDSNCRIVRMYPLSTVQCGRCSAPGGTIPIENCENYAPRGAKYDDLVYSFSDSLYWATPFPGSLPYLQGPEESLHNYGILAMSVNIIETVPLGTLEKCPHIDVSQSKERAIEKSHNLMLDGHLYFKSI